LATRDACVAHVFRVATFYHLQGVLLIQISMTPMDMGQACLSCPNVKVLFHHVHMRLMVMINYDYLVVENDDTKNGWLSYHACLA
jgi:hypothetical protein